jgi:hypothetical protein
MKSKIWLSLSLILVLFGIGLAQTKTVTNLDLEKYKQRREKAEAEYRAKYKERGMPSPEELEQRERESQQWREEFSRQKGYQTQQNQNYWQIRANDLRNQIINVEAQMQYLNAQIANLPTQNQIFVSPQNFYSVGVVQYGNYGNRGNRGSRHPPVNQVNPATSVQTAINAAAANPNPFYGTQLERTGVKLVIGQPQNYHRGYGRPYFGGGYAVPYPVNSNNSQRDELVSRLNYLGQVRAGLLAQWNNLVEEARRAGFKID